MGARVCSHSVVLDLRGHSSVVRAPGAAQLTAPQAGALGAPSPRHAGAPAPRAPRRLQRMRALRQGGPRFVACSATRRGQLRHRHAQHAPLRSASAAASAAARSASICALVFLGLSGFGGCEARRSTAQQPAHHCATAHTGHRQHVHTHTSAHPPLLNRRECVRAGASSRGSNGTAKPSNCAHTACRVSQRRDFAALLTRIGTPGPHATSG